MRSARMTVCWLVIGLAAPGTPGTAQEPQRRVTLEEALRLFAEHSLALRIARAEAAEATGEARQSRAYFNPALSTVREDLGAHDEDYWEMTIGVEQRLEWPGRTAARGRVAARRTAAAEASLRADSIRLAFDVRRAWVEAWAADARETSLRWAASVIERAADAAERRYAEGDISGYELRRLRLERVRGEGELAEAELEASAARRALATLVLPDSDVREVGAAEPPVGVPPEIARVSALDAVSFRADLEAAGRALEAARAELSAAATGWVPDPTLSLGYKDQADGFSGAVLGIRVPVPLFDRAGGASDAARGRRDAAAALLALRQRQAHDDVLAAHERHISTRARLDRARELVDDAGLLLDAAETAWAEGELSLVELLDAARAHRDAGTTAVMLRSDAWIAYYDVLRAMGRAPEENR